MKKLTLFLLAALTLSAAGCAKNGDTDSVFKGRELADVKLFEGASPENSALSVYKYDGDTEVKYLYDVEKEQEIIDFFNETPLYKADISETDGLKNTPMYALDIYGAEVGRIALTWIGSYCVDEAGQVYLADLDTEAVFEKLLTDYPWDDSDTRMTGNHLPNRYYLANRGEWDIKYLNIANNSEPRGISLEIAAHEGSVLTAKITNTTDEENGYSEYFSVQALIDGEWYDIPAEDDVAFNDIAWILPAGESAEKQYDYSWYGDLPNGTYRLVVEGASAEFDIK